jgi:hypothetical protein
MLSGVVSGASVRTHCVAIQQTEQVHSVTAHIAGDQTRQLTRQTCDRAEGGGQTGDPHVLLTPQRARICHPLRQRAEWGSGDVRKKTTEVKGMISIPDFDPGRSEAILEEHLGDPLECHRAYALPLHSRPPWV